MTPLGRIQLVTGLPRSGSTLLQHILAQHPRFHATPTSGLADMVFAAREAAAASQAFRAWGKEEVASDIVASLRGLVVGFHGSRLGIVDGDGDVELGDGVVFDKSRRWLELLDLMVRVLGDRPVIFTLRDLREVACSMEQVYQRDPVGRPPAPLTTPARLNMFFAKPNGPGAAGQGGVIGRPVQFLRDAARRGLLRNMVPVKYHELCRNPQATMDQLHRDLGLEPWGGYDFDNVEQATSENDDVYGFPGLHTTRPKVEPNESPWREVLPLGVAAEIERDYADIQRLVYGGV